MIADLSQIIRFFFALIGVNVYELLIGIINVKKTEFVVPLNWTYIVFQF